MTIKKKNNVKPFFVKLTLFHNYVHYLDHNDRGRFSIAWIKLQEKSIIKKPSNGLFIYLILEHDQYHLIKVNEYLFH